MKETLDILMFLVAIVFLMAGFPVAFTLAGTALIFGLIGFAIGVFDLSFLGLFPQRIFGTMTNEVLIAVPLFIFMGVMLEKSRVAEELLDNMGKLFGTLRGGLGISVTIVGALLAASTGIVGATVVTMGLLSLPTMLRRGYDPALATGTIAAAGTLGQIIPPSIVLVLLGDVISSAYQNSQLSLGIFSPETVSVGDLFAGALLPGLGLVAMYILYQIGVAWLRPAASPAIPRDELGAGDASLLIAILNSLVPPIALIIAVLGSILAGVATPTEAAAVGAIGATLLAGQRLRRDRSLPIYVGALCIAGLFILNGLFDLRLNRERPLVDDLGIILAFIMTAGVVWGVAVSLWRTFGADVLRPVMRSTTQITSMVFIILAGAALFSLVFRGLGGDETVKNILTDMPGGVMGAMITVMVVMFILGFFLDFIEITFVVVPIVAPVLLTMGLDPVWLGVMMAMNLQTSFLTPPFGFALFYLRGVAPDSVRTMQIYKGIVPFVIIQVVALGLLATFPRIATWLPEVIYGDGSVTRSIEGDDTLRQLDGQRREPGSSESEQKDLDKLFDEDRKSDGDTQDEVDQLFNEDSKSEADTQKEIDDLFKEDD
ncbi:MAG: TRAP transporter large permease subunit [Proteobacteria bacterium]|nr:TRAP transporter large permease subunit [Pseudomonadota bacterium]MDA1059315.1 TRAP transporter large permease subunit [Pseudomonadota bacterium]